jgi:hypothetical protein
MAEDVNELERRLARLEMLVATLIAFDVAGDSPEEIEHFISTLRKSSLDKPSGIFWDELFYLFRRSRFPRRYALLSNRLAQLESQCKEMESMPAMLRSEIQELQQKVKSVAFSNSEFQARLQNVSELKENLHYFDKNLHYLKDEIHQESNIRQSIQEELHTYLALQSLGLDPNLVPIHRFLPVRVYLTEANQKQIEAVSDAVTRFFNALGFTISDSFPPQTGSWYKRWFAKTKEAATQPEVVKRLQKGERAIELATLGKYQANVDKEQAEAAATLLRSLDNVPNAVCQIGSILIVKVTDTEAGTRVYTRSLTPHEMIFLERNQTLIQNPKDIFDALSKHCAEVKELPEEEVEELEA